MNMISNRMPFSILMKRISLLILSLFTVGCGGGSPTPVSPPPISPPVALQSPGGQWLGFDSQSRLVNLLVSESGDVRGFLELGTAMEPPAFTAGTVGVSNGDAISGVMRGQDLLSFPPAGLPGAPSPYSCSISGTVTERASMNVQIACSDDTSLVYDEALVLTPHPRYLQGSSLSAIAGNYTLSTNPATNMLNVAEDGTVFGMFDNGPTCTVNGTVSIIDSRYSLLDVSWTLSSCTDLLGFAEGGEYSGFAMPSPDSGAPDSYYFLLIRELPESLSLISVIYDPT